MNAKKSAALLANQLERWFAKVKRPMPWRVHPSPYVCWLSEIMLQQTTYTTALPYYEKFLKKFPTVTDLARASLESVLKAWEGLGYYTRAHHLHRAAQQFVVNGKVLWPHSAEEWQRVPGVGPYTAAALASVLEGERVPVVDGNVARVFARYWLLSDDFKKQSSRAQLGARLQPVLNAAHSPGDLNQAMMELGALVCMPASPRCEACPLAKTCRARRESVQLNYPLKGVKKEIPVRHAKVVIVADEDGRILLVQNRAGGLLKGLWELPTSEEGPSQTHVFSHFKQELTSVCVPSRTAVFRDPASVPLATATRKLLLLTGHLSK